MKERPILFSGPMIRAILEGKKTQTRRVMKPQPELWAQTGTYHYPLDKKPYRGAPIGSVAAIDAYRCPYGRPGDHLWVRETWQETAGDGDVAHVQYRATEKLALNYLASGWRPSIFMPRAFSRIDLEITAVRVERVQEITGNDVIAEGIEFPNGTNPQTAWRDRWEPFRCVWDQINAKRGYPWSSNPWVWVVEFRLA